MAKRKRADFISLLEQAWALPDGPAKVAVLEEAVRDADSREDEADGYFAREELLDATVTAGRGDLLLTHFAWCLAKYDATPDQYDESTLLWRYKWVVGNAIGFPEISLKQINALLADMDRRFQAAGVGARAVAEYRHRLARHIGDAAAAKATYAAFEKTPRDEMSNCIACEADDKVYFLARQGKFRAALDAAGRILAGKLSCNSVPDDTYATLLVPLVRLGDPAEAVRLHKIGYRRALKSGDAVGNFGSHLLFLGLTDNFAAGVKALERTLPAALGGYEPYSQFCYYRGAKFLLDRAVKAGFTAKLRLPANHPLAGAPPATVEALRDWVAGEATKLAERFDKRNGTTAFADELTGLSRLHRHAVAHVL